MTDSVKELLERDLSSLDHRVEVETEWSDGVVEVMVGIRVLDDLLGTDLDYGLARETFYLTDLTVDEAARKFDAMMDRAEAMAVASAKGLVREGYDPDLFEFKLTLEEIDECRASHPSGSLYKQKEKTVL